MSGNRFNRFRRNKNPRDDRGRHNVLEDPAGVDDTQRPHTANKPPAPVVSQNQHQQIHQSPKTLSPQIYGAPLLLPNPKDAMNIIRSQKEKWNNNYRPDNNRKQEINCILRLVLPEQEIDMGASDTESISYIMDQLPCRLRAKKKKAQKKIDIRSNMPVHQHVSVINKFQQDLPRFSIAGSQQFQLAVTAQATEQNSESTASSPSSTGSFARAPYRKNAELKLYPRLTVNNREVLIPFYSHKATLSNSFPTRFVTEGRMFNCAAQYYYVKKAEFHGNFVMANELMHYERACDMKFRCDALELFDQNWNRFALEIMARAICCKFDQNAYLRMELLRTEGTILVDTDTSDLFFGAGVAMNDERILSPIDWPGLNRTGFILMNIRKQMLDDPRFAREKVEARKNLYIMQVRQYGGPYNF